MNILAQPLSADTQGLTVGTIQEQVFEAKPTLPNEREDTRPFVEKVMDNRAWNLD